MAIDWRPIETAKIVRYIFKWILLASIVGVMGGCASAVFLVSLDWATTTREQYRWLVYLLPLGGMLIGLAYYYFGRDVEAGNNLLIDEIHEPKAGVPILMAPLVLIGTIGTHLFGGSAGREGTAVQMGGSLASWFARRAGLDLTHSRILLMAGVAAGFGSVFGTPLAGMVFALEVLSVGRIRYDALLACLVASLVGDWTCQGLGVGHTQYFVASTPTLRPLVVGKVLLASLAFGFASLAFVELTHTMKRMMGKLIPWAPGRPIVGGLAVILLMWIVGTRDYLGLGIPLILKSFDPAGVVAFAFVLKLVFTAITLGAGFKGGEVTPLFCIGATLGCTMGRLMGLPPDFTAALGFVAVFAGAANTPLACTIMGIELFGSQHGVSIAIACCVSYFMSGHRSIYATQRMEERKHD